MLLPLPLSFDANEWFVIVSILIAVGLLVWLPRRFSKAVGVLIFLFNAVLAKSTDFSLAAGLPFDLYDYGDTPLLDFFDEPLQLIQIPLIGCLTVYAYDFWRSKGYSIPLYILVGSILSVLYEFISIKAHLFHYKGWNLFYSALTYPFLIGSNIYFYSLVRKWETAIINKNKESQLA